MKPSQAVAPLLAGVASCSQTTLLPSGWSVLKDLVSPSEPIQLSFALNQPNVKDLESVIGQGKPHLSLEQIRDLRAPDPAQVQLVTDWLRDNGIQDLDVSNEWVHVTTDVSTAESLLNMQLSKFTFDGGPAQLRTQTYDLPYALEKIVKYVYPVDNFMRPRKRVKMSESQPDGRAAAFSASQAAVVPCKDSVGPKCIRELYGIDYDTSQESPSRTGIAGFLEQYTNYADVQTFLQQETPEAVGRNFTVESVNGGADDQSNPGVEAALDIDYVVGLAARGEITFYSSAGRGVMLGDDGKPITGPDNSNEPYLALLEYLLSQPDDRVPHVLSISYGDDEQSVPADYAKHVCDSLGLLTARGVTIVSSSGDGGATGSHSSRCISNDGTNRQITVPTFPATCPWVTSIGATANGVEPPVAADFSSGGFSNLFRRPKWQQGADLVDGYVQQLGDHLEGKFNGSMRAFPDMAAIGTTFRVVLSNRTIHVDGTSASAPTVAAMLSLVNDARLKKGRTSLGWLNDRLYSKEVRSVLQDVTKGVTLSCNWNGTRPGGWPALPGWDAATGLGVPKDFGKFLQVLVDADY